jgi:hypothetical protein
MLSKCDLKMYLSMVTYFPPWEKYFHCPEISFGLKRPPLRELTAFSKSLLVIVFFLASEELLKERKNWKADSLSVKEHYTKFFNSMNVWSFNLKGESE